jgi:diguanylate cyclase (GGDEF)-like protein
VDPPNLKHQDERTIVVPRHGTVILVHPGSRDNVAFHSLDDMRQDCDVRPVEKLHDIHSLAASYNHAILFLTDPFPIRQWPLRVLRSTFDYIPITFSTSHPEQAAILLEEGLIDALFTPETLPLLRRAMILNLIERAAWHAYTRRRNSELNLLSISDSLTRLYNHGHLLEILEREFRRADRSHEPLACLMIDIDHFKTVNDTYGHRFGDFILSGMANLLRSNLRQSDIVGRYGGEEFMIILPGTDVPAASNLAEKLRSMIENFRFHDAQHAASITASFGVASNTDQNVFNPEHLLQLSDRALYFAKESGRNRVCTAQEFETITDFDIFRHRLTDDQHHAPLLVLLTGNPQLRENMSDAADGEKCQLISFDDPALFAAEFQALTPNLIFIDTTGDYLETNFLNQTTSVAREAALPVAGIIDEKQNPSSSKENYLFDDFLTSDLSSLQLRHGIRRLLNLANLRREHRHLSNELRLAQRHLIRNERMRSIGEIAMGMAHEINNTLSAVMGAAHLLARRGDLADDARRLAVQIEHSSHDGATSVERLQSFLSPEQAREQERHRLARLIDEAIEFTRGRWRDEAQSMQIRYEMINRVDSRLNIMGNAAEIKEALIKLILNALDAMPSGGSVAFDATTSPSNVVLTIADEGIGMDEQTQRHAFDPFFSTKQDKSSGLGLYVVFSTMKRHGGRVDMESQPGRGTQIRLTFPRLTPFDTPPPHTAEPSPAESNDTPVFGLSTGNKLKILVIDDEPMVRDVHSKLLKRLGHDVDTASGGNEALEHASKISYDVIFTDLSMPQISGWETARRLRELCPNSVVVLLSGWGRHHSDEMLQTCGISHVLAKPVTTRQLKDLLSRIKIPPARPPDPTGSVME